LQKVLKNGKTYVGFTSKAPLDRVKEHNQGANNWSKANKALELIYFEQYYCAKDARTREKYFKSGIGKRVKYAIIKEFEKVA
jgi:putative endonuclease